MQIHIKSVYRNQFYFTIATKNRAELKIMNNCQFFTADNGSLQPTYIDQYDRVLLYWVAFILATFL